MPNPDFIYRNSRFFENLFEHRFLFDLCRHLVLSKEQKLLKVLKLEVDAFGFDLMLSVADRIIYIQMKTRSGAPSSSPYQLSDALWKLPNACAIWMRYDPSTLEPCSYYVLGFPIPPIENFRLARPGYRFVKMGQANHRELELAELATLLFPAEADPEDQP